MPINEEQKNKDFVQFKRPFLDEIAKLGSENSMAFKLFMFVCKHMDGGNALCVSMQTLTELLETSRQTLSKAVKYLKDNGWLCVLKSGTSNVYIINPDVAWTSYSDQKQYCRFQATVVLSASENNAFLNSRKAITRFKTIDTEFIDNMKKENEEYRSSYEERLKQA
ncbi:helix-turn-helix domain-containing protein [Clostridium botulinum]|uniref:helix-turn-helix domain-containing protein n=1 Tax=Clostridium sp. ZS6 TaxID=2949987 RepID=UPI001D437F3A|nr:helix-turn-helix domain-containing protein [Clostridium sp. ZS6]NFO89540.1 helix-turn-helix domain-containing protein [Clostridium botulinum]